MLNALPQGRELEYKTVDPAGGLPSSHSLKWPLQSREKDSTYSAYSTFLDVLHSFSLPCGRALNIYNLAGLDHMSNCGKGGKEMRHQNTDKC